MFYIFGNYRCSIYIFANATLTLFRMPFFVVEKASVVVLYIDHYLATLYVSYILYGGHTLSVAGWRSYISPMHAHSFTNRMMSMPLLSAHNLCRSCKVMGTRVLPGGLER